MARRFKGLRYEVYQLILSELPRCFDEKSYVEDGNDMIHVSLSDSVILKVYDDHLMIDQGGRKVFIKPEDFVEISIT